MPCRVATIDAYAGVDSTPKGRTRRAKVCIQQTLDQRTDLVAAAAIWHERCAGSEFCGGDGGDGEVRS